MKLNSLALVAVATLLMGCGGNSLNNPLLSPDSGTTGTDETDGTITAASAVVVDETLAGELKSAKIIPGVNGAPDTLLIAITGLDTSPLNSTWQRRPNLDTPGYQAFLIQEDPLDRLFIGLAASSADKSVAATVAGDGGQITKVFGGANYTRTGAYTPPNSTQAGPGRGQVSYKGKYAGLLNGGAEATDALPIPPGRDTVESEIPGQAARITGDVFVNANFADNKLNGVIKNRNTIDLQITNDNTSANFNNGSGVVLEDVLLLPTDILANGTFTGDTQRPSPSRASLGQYGGVIGGTNGSSIAGAVYSETVINSAGDPIESAIERGIFVLDQCGLTATAGGDCLGTAP